MVSAYSIYGRNEKCIFFVRKPEGKSPLHLEVLGKDGGLILRQILWK